MSESCNSDDGFPFDISLEAREIERSERRSELSGKVTCFPVSGRDNVGSASFGSFKADLPGVAGLPAGLVGKLSGYVGDNGTTGVRFGAEAGT